MQLSKQQQWELDLAIERLVHKVAKLRKDFGVKLGETGEPEAPGYVEDDPKREPVNSDWGKLIEPENSAANAVISSILATAPRPTEMAELDAGNLWVWGGPTPYWGGSTADDCLVRGADYFGADNVVYVYGETNEKMLGIHAEYKSVLCQINSQCRSPGAQNGMTDAENAERLGELSLRFPNVRGAMCDDVVGGYRKIILPEEFEARYAALKKHNPALKMYGVVYTRELHLDFSLVQPYFDVVNLWFWNKEEILEFDEHLARCQQAFPGKKILLGVFLHDYGTGEIATPTDLLLYQLDKCREYVKKGVAEGVVILGDREIKKWHTTAAAVKEYLRNQTE